MVWRRPCQKSARENPLVFSADLISQWFLELVGENAPSVGLDLEVWAGCRVFLEIGESGFSVVKGGSQWGKGFGV